MSAWKTRVAELYKKEARCPACAKAKKENEGTTMAGVCHVHQRIRCQMVFG